MFYLNVNLVVKIILMYDKNNLKKRDLFYSGIASLIIVLLVVIAASGLVVYTIVNSGRSPSGSITENIKNVVVKPSPTPTPFPFAEMTVPYLRSREYNSGLNNLEKVDETSTYTSYLTSYNSDGFKVNGLLTIPKGDEPQEGWPAVVFVHGYIPPKTYQTLKNYVSYVDSLAKNGLVVFKIDLRGNGDSEGLALGGYYSDAYVVDTLNAYTALQSADFVDPQKVYLWGHSMAGNIVFRSMVVKENIPKVVIWAGAVYSYSDMSEFRIHDNSYQPPPQESERQKKRQELFDMYGRFDPNSDFWRQVVPTNYLDGVTGFLQIHHAVNDPVVNIGYSRNLISILNGTDIDHALYEYPSGGHNITGGSYSTAMQRTVEFFKE
jgi:dipeptidyl aminopeptidase/acylaminoacyl peptidase